MWGVYNADLYSEDDREIEVMEPVRVLNLFTIMNRGGAETMVMNYYRKINREKVQFDFLVHREEEGAYEQEIKEQLRSKVGCIKNTTEQDRKSVV